jgi:hemerythrin
MDFIEWNESYIIGVPEIDKQHKEIWDILNTAYKVTEQGYTEHGIKNIIQRLIEYAILHFAYEERFMRIKSYTGIDQHIHEHMKFWEQLKPITTKVVQREEVILLDVISFIKTWILGHVITTDMKLKELV